MMYGILAAFVWAAVRFAADFLAEEDIRRRNRRIRGTQARLRTEQVEIQRLTRQVQRGRNQREYLRRGALIRYRKAQRELIEIGLQALNDAKSAAFSKLKVVAGRIHGGPRSFIDERLFDEFRTLNRQVHETIAESKVLTSVLANRLQQVNAELDELHDASTHTRLGGKKRIAELLKELHRDGRQQLAGKDARDSVLRLGSVSYVLERRCPGCRAWLSPVMVACPLCGARKGDHAPVRFFKKDIGDAQACSGCYAPTMDEFVYCFNCGERQDPFGLRAAL